MTTRNRAIICAALKVELERAKTQIIHDFKIRGLSSEDVAKHNKAMRRIYVKAGLPVTTADLMPDYCAEVIKSLEDAYYKRMQEICGGESVENRA